MRHPPPPDLITEYDPRRGVSIATLAYEYPRGYRVPEHSHGSDQLIYAIGGVMEASVGRSVWLIPPHFALWIPARTTHSIRIRVRIETAGRLPRLMKAVELLVSGRSVKEVSFVLGYRQPAAFVNMFRGVLGSTPKAWIQALQRLKLK